MYKLIVSDFDDTLLRSDKTLSEYTETIIPALKKQGIPFTFCSGRMFDSLIRYVEKLQIEIPVISYNGALIMDPNTRKVINQWPIETDLAVQIISELEELGLYVQVYIDDKMYCREITEITQMYTSVTGSKAHPTGKPLSQCVYAPPTKILTITYPETVQKLLPAMQKKYECRSVVTVSNPEFLEFVSPKAGKGKALALLAEQMGVKREEILAFGDSLNDISMLEYAGHSVAVGNAREEVKQIADECCLSNDEDGVAKYVARFIQE